MPSYPRHQRVNSRAIIAAAQARVDRVEDTVLPSSLRRIAATKVTLSRSLSRQTQARDRIAWMPLD
jgi:hypothetical protein